VVLDTQTLLIPIQRLGSGDLGDEVVDRAKYLLLDYLGVALAGSLTESSRPVHRMLHRSACLGPCTVIGTATKTSPEFAALANGTAAHSVELDDTHQAGSIHPGVVIFSTAIALSEAYPDIDAGQFLVAVVAGYDVATRVAMAAQPKVQYELGFHPTSTCGVFGAAVTASKLLRLDPKQMLSAVGITGSMAAGSLEFLAEGAWTKRLHPGLAAQNGILAAKLAVEGFRGPRTILEGRDGFFHAYSRQPIPELAMRNLNSFEILQTSVKPHACCRYMQAPIDALIELAKEHDIHPEQIERVEVAVLEAGWPLVCAPQERKYSPANIADAQFSMPYGAAVALTERSAGLDQFTDAKLTSPELRSLMRKVVLTKDARLEEKFPEVWPARVQIELKGGRKLEKFVRYPKGDPQNPLTWAEMSAKFESLASRVLPKPRCAQIVQSVKEMNSPASLRKLWSLTAGADSLSKPAN
jgi:2-methylcitrate dehydratase PrpD